MKNNFHETIPGVIEKVVLKSFEYRGRNITVLDSALLIRDFDRAKKMLEWIKRNCDLRTLQILLMLTHVYISISVYDLTSDYAEATEILLTSLEIDSKILKNVLLRPGALNKCIHEFVAVF